MTENNENKDINPIDDNTHENASSEKHEESSITPAETLGASAVTVKKGKSNFNLLKEVWEWFYTILIAFIVVMLIKNFLFDIVRVDGPSMNPTLTHNDRLLVTKLNYKPKAGDIVILDATYSHRQEYYSQLEEEQGKSLNWFTEQIEYSKLPQELKRKYYVKRIIGMPGDTIDIQNGIVYVNGKALDEPYINNITLRTDYSVTYPQTVKEDHVFVLGDNRGNSTDSRSSNLGQVPFKALLGKSQFRIWPFSAFGKTE